MSVANIKQEPLDSFDAEDKNGDYGSSDHVTALKGDNSKPINQEEMLHVMSIISRCEHESSSPQSDDTRPDSQFAANGCDGEFKHECTICNARFKSARAFRGHGVIHRLGFDPIKRRISSADVGQVSSSYCRKNGFEDSLFKCDLCHTVFGSRDTYAMHMLMRAKDENCKARAHVLGTDVESRTSVGDISTGQVNKNVKISEGIYNINDVTKENNKAFSEYKGLMPEFISGCSDSRQMLACHQCGEVFSNKDTLAMHAMYHTQDSSQQDKPQRWAVIYSSPVTGLGSSPDPYLVHNVTPDPLQQNQLLTSSNTRFDVDASPDSNSLSTTPSLDQGLDLSLNSPRGKSTTSSNSHKQSVSKSNDDVAAVCKQSDGNNAVSAGQTAVERSQEGVSKASVLNAAVSPQQRAVSADSGAAMLHAQEITHIAGSSETNKLHRPKSTDCAVFGRETTSGVTPVRVVSREPQSFILNRMRKSRFPMRKLPYGFRLVPKPWRQPEKKHVPESTARSDVVNNTTSYSSGSSNPNQRIAEMLNLKGKDLSYCKFCEIVYLDRTLYQLHMGLHNVNDPWQCNACGRVCGNRLDFSSHVLHY